MLLRLQLFDPDLISGPFCIFFVVVGHVTFNFFYTAKYQWNYFASLHSIKHVSAKSSSRNNGSKQTDNERNMLVRLVFSYNCSFFGTLNHFHGNSYRRAVTEMLLYSNKLWKSAFQMAWNENIILSLLLVIGWCVSLVYFMALSL